MQATNGVVSPRAVLNSFDAKGEMLETVPLPSKAHGHATHGDGEVGWGEPGTTLRQPYPQAGSSGVHQVTSGGRLVPAPALG